LDGGESPNNALHNLFSSPFNNWSLGLQMSVPIGYRAAHAAVRDAQLAVRRSYWSLRTDEEEAERFLALAYRQVFEFEHQIQINQAALRAATGQLAGYIELFRAGRAAAADANLILALQNFSNSIGSYYAAIAQYNSILATFQFAKGSIMERDKVFISEGPVPACAQERAVEHERQRTNAIALHDIEHPVAAAFCPDGPAGVETKLPSVPDEGMLSLPAVQQTRLPVPELLENPTATVSSPPSNPQTEMGPEVPHK
jgi:hypothetical protein